MSKKEKKPADSSKSKTPVKPADSRKSKKTEKGMSLLDMVKFFMSSGRLSLYIDGNEKPFAEISDSNNKKTFCDIYSKNFKGWLAEEYSKYNGKLPAQHDIRSVIEHIDYLACKNGQPVNLAMRFAEDNGIHYIDMANDAGQVIQISPDGWEIVNAASLSLKFLRHKTMRPLVATVSPGEGDPKRILKYLNMSEEGKMFYMVSMCMTPFVDIERPLICFKGREGSAKTTAARLFRSVFDASDPLESNCRMTSGELSIVYSNSAVPLFDNVSGINKKASDMFCQLVTGGAYTKRTLFTNADTFILSFKRMALMTALNKPSSAPDFLDRCIIIEMDRVTKPVGLEELMGKFNDDLPIIRAGCLNTIVKAKGLYPDIQIDGLPRLADFGKWGAAVAKALGYDPQKFVDILKNRINAHKSTAVMEQKPAVKAIVEYIDDNSEFEGYTTDLLKALKKYCPYRSGFGKEWPQKANGLGMIVSKSIRDLKNIGIIVERTTPKEGTY